MVAIGLAVAAGSAADVLRIELPQETAALKPGPARN